MKCHAEEKYRVGEVRDGISVSIPTTPFLAIEGSQIVRSAIAHGLLWIFGLAFVGFAMQRLNQQLTLNYKFSRDVLVESETKYRGIFNESVAAIYIFDAHYTIDSKIPIKRVWIFWTTSLLSKIDFHRK